MKYAIPALLLAFTPQSQAINIRTFSSSTHGRFLSGYPSDPVINPSFLHDATRFTGVGWLYQAGNDSASDIHVTAISPRHVLRATHVSYVGTSSTLRFLDSDGTALSRGISAVTPVPHDLDNNSDVTILTLSSPLPDTVKPLPYLNLANESNYSSPTYNSLKVFGCPNNGATRYATNSYGGQGTLSSFTTKQFLDGNNNVVIGETRFLRFSYQTGGSGANDCHLAIGDSGAPVFSQTTGGIPALIGINAAVESGPNYTNYSTFIPHYVAEIDSILESSGHRLRPAIVTPSTFSLDSSTSPGLLRRLHAGTITLTFSNTGSQLAGNVELLLTFPSGQSPTSVTSTGSVVDSPATGQWSIRRATLANGSSFTATLQYDLLPDLEELAPTAVLRTDATEDDTHNLSFSLAPSYASWSNGLNDPGQDDDPDQDGFTNLIEYALGSDPDQGNLLDANLSPLNPMLELDGQVRFRHLERTDASLRGLQYIVETTTDLEEAGWSTTLPAGATSQTQPLDPPVSGLVTREYSWPSDGPKRFVRLRVELDETP